MAVKTNIRKEVKPKAPVKAAVKNLTLEQQTEAVFSLETTESLMKRNSQMYTFYLNMMVFCPRELSDKEKREWKVIRKILRRRDVRVENMKGAVMQCKIDQLKKSYGF